MYRFRDPPSASLTRPAIRPPACQPLNPLKPARFPPFEHLAPRRKAVAALRLGACSCIAVLLLGLAHAPSWAAAAAPESKNPPELKKLAAVVTVYTKHSHADILLGRYLEGATVGVRQEHPRFKLVSLYMDQTPKEEIGRGLAQQNGVRLSPTPADAITLGTGKLAVDGVLLICEFGDYPTSDTGQVQFPKRRLFDQIAAVFKTSGRVVPLFCDKHLSDNWTDAKEIYDTTRQLRTPLMAGSSLPGTWRYPPVDVKRDAKLEQIMVLSYHTLDAYGFHALEVAQALAERRQGGETGVKAVQCLVDQAVWDAGANGTYDPKLLAAGLDRVVWRPYTGTLEKAVAHPVLWVIDYQDGLRVNVITLNYAIGQWATAWRYQSNPAIESTLFWTQEGPPFEHFEFQLEGIESMILSGQPAWPAERTLMSSGLLDALLISKKQGGKRLETPQLRFSYKSAWNWQQPPAPTGPRLFFPK